MKKTFKLSRIIKGPICVFLFVLILTPNNVFAVTNTKNVSATIGKVTSTFKYAIATTTKITDFVVTQSINKGTAKVVKPKKVIAKASVIVADKANAAIALVVKSSPGMPYKTLGTIKTGTAVAVYGGIPIGMDQGDWYGYQQYGWSKIKYGKVYAWVKTDELKFANPYNWAPGIKEKFENEIIQQGYARVKTSIKYKIFKKLPAGATGPGYYEVYTDVSGQQCIVNVNVKTGWYHG